MRLLLVLFVSLILGSCQSPEPKPFALKTGDILFQDLDCGPYCESIETVTQGYKGSHLSHCGIFARLDGEDLVIEANTEGVGYVPLEEFLSRSKDAEGKPKVLVGRLKPEYDHVVARSLELAEKKLNKPYDAVYNISDDTYYCSELVYHVYLDQGVPVFDLSPMTFKAAGSDSTFAIWQEYFDKRGIEVPEGQLGLNPGGISLSPKLDIVHIYGQPEGMN